jgi:hypothetical protein
MIKLHIYKAISIIAKLKGSNNPLIMEVETEDGAYLDYVVKVFNQNRIFNSQPTNKEFYAYALAKAFDLKVPQAAIIYVSNNLLSQIKEIPEFKKQDIQHGLYFGSKYIECAVSFDFSNFEDWELENIFVFDALIQNKDRRACRPNLFEADREIYLIDHELSLNTYSDCKSLFENEMTWNFLDNLDVNPKNSHLAFERLKILNRLASLEFDEFLLHLRALNPVLTLRNIALQLDEAAENYEGLESDTSDIENIITYLNCIKVNEKQFVERLKQLLS